MKIAVYAIAKNEELFAKRWAESSKEADYRIVADTGSSDTTIELLKSSGVSVHSITVNPWRFDTARNLSLSLVPDDADVCIALDLDEVLQPGWREALEAAWTPSTTLLRYIFVPKLQADGITPEYFTYGFRVHARHAYTWKYAVHELLRPIGTHEETWTETLKIHHHPDTTKIKNLYFEMLQSLVTTEPNESRYSFYLAQELFDRQLFQNALTEYQRFLLLPTSLDPGERSFAMRTMTLALKYLNDSSDLGIGFLLKAAAEAPREREPWFTLATEFARIKNWPNCFSATINTLRCNDPRQSYRHDPRAWGNEPSALLNECAKALGIPDEKLFELGLRSTPTSL